MKHISLHVAELLSAALAKDVYGEDQRYYQGQIAALRQVIAALNDRERRPVINVVFLKLNEDECVAVFPYLIGPGPESRIGYTMGRNEIAFDIELAKKLSPATNEECTAIIYEMCAIRGYDLNILTDFKF